MAENMDSSFFSIEETINLGGGAGDANLLKDLIAPETATASEGSLTPIDDTTTTEETTKKEDESVIENFLDNESTTTEETTKEPTKEPLKETDDKGEETTTSEEGNSFTALAKDLFSLGVFNKEEGETDSEITTPEQFLERFQMEKKKGAMEVVNNFIGQFGEDYQQAFDAIYVKGVSPKDYFGVYNNIVNYSELDLTKEENQIAVIKQALADQEFEPEDITTEIERLKNYGDLEAVAQKHHKVIIKKEAAKLKQMEEQSERDLQIKAAVKNQFVSNVQTILKEKVKAKDFDGIPLNPKMAEELQDFLLVDKYKTPTGETLTEFDRTILELKRPENHAIKVKLGLLLKILEKDPSLSTIQKSAVTKKTDQIFSEVARQVTKVSSNKTAPTTKSSWNL